MTDRQLVLSLSPQSRLIHMYGNTKPIGARKYRIASFAFTFWHGQGDTPKEAWRAAAQYIKTEMLKKLESA